MARWCERAEEERCRNYICDCLLAVSGNTAKVIPRNSNGVTGMAMTQRFSEIKTRKETAPKESGTEIADRIIGRLAKKD